MLTSDMSEHLTGEESQAGKQTCEYNNYDDWTSTRYTDKTVEMTPTHLISLSLQTCWIHLSTV